MTKQQADEIHDKLKELEQLTAEAGHDCVPLATVISLTHVALHGGLEAMIALANKAADWGVEYAKAELVKAGAPPNVTNARMVILTPEQIAAWHEHQRIISNLSTNGIPPKTDGGNAPVA